jgi:hypothetical protein
MVLVGQVPFEVNNTFVITITKGSISGDRPVTVKRGAAGTIGTSVGQENVSASLELAVPVTGLELDVVGALNDPKGFTLSFSIGAERHALYGCQRSKRAFSNSPDSGDTTFSLDITATDWIRVK